MEHALKKRPLRPTVICVALAFFACSTISSISAHNGATGVMKGRMDLMKGMADAMKIMGRMFKGEIPLKLATVFEKAGFLADHARTIPDLTPKGNDGHPSEVLPLIWQEWDDYVVDANTLAEESAKLLAPASDRADETEARAQYVKLGKTCGTCHDRFRKPKE